MLNIEWKSFKHFGMVAMATTPEVWNLDWDIPDPSHHFGSSVTIQSRGEALELLKAWCDKHPGHLFKVYETHGGVRAFCVSHRYTVHNAPWEGLRADPNFIKQMKKNGYWRTRISPKKGRGEKMVYRHLLDVGDGKPMKKLSSIVEEVLKQSAIACL